MLLSGEQAQGGGARVLRNIEAANYRLLDARVDPTLKLYSRHDQSFSPINQITITILDYCTETLHQSVPHNAGIPHR